jgi:two-component system, NtrC family, response regulator HydG
MAPERVLVVDDLPDAVELMRRYLVAAGFEVYTATSVTDAIQVAEQAWPDLVVTDLRMPDGGGLELVRHVREHMTDTEVMLVTGYGTIEGAVEALQIGASHYIVKPYTEEELLAAVRQTLGKLRRSRSARPVPGPAVATATAGGLIGGSPAMQALASEIARAAASSATVLITGESGTGKELVAKAIHDQSRRHRKPFVPVNCGALAESLLESELFGHVRGAFTGADRTRPGVFQAAEGGTILLDEISGTPPSTQLRLLRVLQEREVAMVGSSTPLKVDVRVIAATNRDLADLVARGSFREDLFYRVNVLTIATPPLRERGDDVLLLAHHFATVFAAELDRPPLRFSDPVLRRLLDYSWPGNVRELQNLVLRLTVMKDGETAALPDLPQAMRTARRTAPGARSLDDMEAGHIRAVLAGVSGNKARAARILGIDRKTLYAKIRRYGLEETISD